MAIVWYLYNKNLRLFGQTSVSRSVRPYHIVCLGAAGFAGSSDVSIKLNWIKICDFFMRYFWAIRWSVCSPSAALFAGHVFGWFQPYLDFLLLSRVCSVHCLSLWYWIRLLRCFQQFFSLFFWTGRQNKQSFYRKFWDLPLNANLELGPSHTYPSSVIIMKQKSLLSLFWIEIKCSAPKDNHRSIDK